MRKSFHGLAAIVTQQMRHDVLSGDIYIFISKRRNAIKLLRFEGDGFAIFYKQLEKGIFEMPEISDDSISIKTNNEKSNKQLGLGFVLPGLDGSTIGSCRQCGFSPGRTYNFQLWFLTSAKHF